MNINTNLFDNYPEVIRIKICNVLKDIIFETFVYTADSDYINARFLSLNFQYRPFFWPALHAIEKYLKANLLFYGVSVKDRKYGHNINFLAEELCKYTDLLKNLKLHPHQEHAMLAEHTLWGTDDVETFLKSLEEYGNPSNRYNYYGSECEASYLLKLDQVVYALRTNVAGNEILHPLRKNSSLSYFAYEQNYCFAPSSYNHESMCGKFGLGSSVPALEAALKGLYGNANIFEAWVNQNMYFGKNEIQKIKC